MAVLFKDYELIANSGLFDADFYLRAHPAVARENVDPLTHYLETGHRNGFDPSSTFDTKFYRQQCRALGLEPDNALLHYINVGASQGLRPSARYSAPPKRTAIPRSPTSHLLSIDIPRLADGPTRVGLHDGLSIVGWALAPAEVASVEIALDGKRVAVASYGLRRPDVALAHPQITGNLTGGYAAHLPPSALTAGWHQVAVSLTDRKGGRSQQTFDIEVESALPDRLPWTIRRKMNHAEVSFKLDVIAALGAPPAFELIVPLGASVREQLLVRQTLSSLSRQTYPHWQVCLLPQKAVSASMHRKHVRRFASEFTELSERITYAASRVLPAANSRFVATLAAGDELGCDALLELALAAARSPQADFLYCDEQWELPFYKPDWSPDLLLSFNYVGRAWCAERNLLQRLNLDTRELLKLASYDLTLRLTESARCIYHVRELLYRRRAEKKDPLAAQRRALVSAMKRRAIEGLVRHGATPGTFRVRRTIKPKRVSIIIPTRASNGFIRRCLQTLRAYTTYPDYEVICVENIPKGEQPWKAWLQGESDRCLRAVGEFNWSRYNNQAAAHATGDYLLFLNDDVEFFDREWLRALVEQVQRPEVGVVGPLLLYPDRSVQHAGMVLDDEGRGLHAFRHLPSGDGGYFGLALSQRNVIAVTGACLMTRRETFETLGRFDESHDVINNDLDFCLRAHRHGLLSVYTPHSQLIHHEMGSRATLPETFNEKGFRGQWHQVIALGDPYFNPHLARDTERFSIEDEPVQYVHAGHPLFDPKAIRRVLAVKLDHIGDCINAIPAIRRLKRLLPHARLSVLTSSSAVPIWKAESSVDDIIEFDFFHARSELGQIELREKDTRQVQAQLRSHRFDLAIDLRKQPETRHVLQWSGAQLLVGYDIQGRFPWLDVALEWDEDTPLRAKHGHIADDLSALVEALSIRADCDRTPLIARDSSRPAVTSLERRLFVRPLICVHPAAGSAMRQWEGKRFTDLTALLAGHDTFNIAFIGAANERSPIDTLLKSLGRRNDVFNLAGHYSLSELPALLSRAALFVGNNSGPHHIAAALGVPTIGIHSGVVDSTEWGSAGPRSIAIRRAMSCSPCFLERQQDCQRELACLKGISVGSVYRACLSMLGFSAKQIAPY